MGGIKPDKREYKKRCPCEDIDPCGCSVADYNQACDDWEAYHNSTTEKLHNEIKELKHLVTQRELENGEMRWQAEQVEKLQIEIREFKSNLETEHKAAVIEPRRADELQNELDKKDKESKKLFDSLDVEYREVERLKNEVEELKKQGCELREELEDVVICANRIQNENDRLRSNQSGTPQITEDEINFIYSLLPEWVRVQEKDLDPTMYGTLSYEGDCDVKRKLDAILNKLSKGE